MNDMLFKNQDRINLIVCIGITFIVFANALTNGFVNWDDPVNFINHPVISSELNLWSSLKEIFSTTVIGNYNPLSTASFLIDKSIFGFENEWGWHLINILLHLGNVGLVYVISRKLGLGSAAALVVGLLFGIHPMRVESVTWVTERKDVLFGLFYLLSINQYLNFKKENKRSYQFKLILFFILSLLSKIQAVSLPLSLLAIDYLLDGKWELKHFISKWYLFLLSLCTGVAGIIFLGEGDSLAVDYSGISGFDNVILAGYSLIVYLYKFFIPYPLASYYQHPESLAPIHYLGLLSILAYVGALFYAFKRNKNWLFFSLFFFIVNIFFVLQWVKAGQGFLADRFTYIPYLGLFLGIGYFISQYQKSSKAKLIYIVAFIVIIAYSILSILQNKVWENGETLWTQSIKVNPGSGRSYAARGNYYIKQGDKKKALQDYNNAVLINDSPAMKGNRALLILETSRDIADLKLALNDLLSIENKTIDHYLNIGAIYSMLGNNNDAISNFNKGESAYPSNFNIPLNRGRLNQAMGNYEQAIVDFEKAIKLNPNSYEAFFEKGRLLRNLQRADESVLLLNNAIKLNNGFCNSYYERSIAYTQTGKHELAKQDLKKAIDLNCENIDPGYKKQLGF